MLLKEIRKVILYTQVYPYSGLTVIWVTKTKQTSTDTDLYVMNRFSTLRCSSESAIRSIPQLFFHYIYTVMFLNPSAAFCSFQHLIFDMNKKNQISFLLNQDSSGNTEPNKHISVEHASYGTKEDQSQVSRENTNSTKRKRKKKKRFKPTNARSTSGARFCKISEINTSLINFLLNP